MVATVVAVKAMEVVAMAAPEAAVTEAVPRPKDTAARAPAAAGKQSPIDIPERAQVAHTRLKGWIDEACY